VECWTCETSCSQNPWRWQSDAERYRCDNYYEFYDMFLFYFIKFICRSIYWM